MSAKNEQLYGAYGQYSPSVAAATVKRINLHLKPAPPHVEHIEFALNGDIVPIITKGAGTFIPVDTQSQETTYNLFTYQPIAGGTRCTDIIYGSNNAVTATNADMRAGVPVEIYRVEGIVGSSMSIPMREKEEEIVLTLAKKKL